MTSDNKTPKKPLKLSGLSGKAGGGIRPPGSGGAKPGIRAPGGAGGSGAPAKAGIRPPGTPAPAARPATGSRAAFDPSALKNIGAKAAAPERRSAGASVPERRSTERNLTLNEREARMRALELARQQEEAEQARIALKAQEEAERTAAERERAEMLAAEEKAIQAQLNEQDLKQQKEAETRRKAEEEARRKLDEEEETRRQARLAAIARAQGKRDDRPAPAAEPAKKPAGENFLAGGRIKQQRKTVSSRDTDKNARTDRRKSAQLTVNKALAQDEDRQRSLAAVRRRREKERQQDAASRKEGRKVVRDVVIPDTITVQELANRMAERGSDVVKALMKMGVMVTINQSIDADTAELVTEDLGHRVNRTSEADIEIGLGEVQENDADLKPRPPVVTIMGHVDHGKTSLLDALRKTSVVTGEAGGITQHIGAYQVKIASGDKITFFDTPGHAAFTEMRARGANVTDIVIIVVAADDGIMPQTIEAINHARAAGGPIIVAINKIDRPGADPQKIVTDLLQHELVAESMGGEVQICEVSAVTGQGLKELQEAIVLQSEVLELTANPDRPARGVVVEAKLEQGRGSVATVLVQQGTLKVGDHFVVGEEYGKVRALMDDHGKRVKNAPPAFPVEVLGLNGSPMSGDDLIAVESEQLAREISESRKQRALEKRQAVAQRTTLDQMFSAMKEGTADDLAVVLKGDVQGSLQAIEGALEQLSTDEVRVKILHRAVGQITESDITLAKASNALIVGFNVRANPRARDAAKQDGIDIRYFSIIYELIDDVKGLMSGMLKPEMRENFLGYAEIREVFSITKTGKVAGCYITEGMVKRGSGVRLLRDGVVIHTGSLKTLRRFKDEVKEVQHGYECGMAFENYQDIQEGDQIECFEVQAIARSL